MMWLGWNAPEIQRVVDFSGFPLYVCLKFLDNLSLRRKVPQHPSWRRCWPHWEGASHIVCRRKTNFCPLRNGSQNYSFVCGWSIHSGKDKKGFLLRGPVLYFKEHLWYDFGKGPQLFKEECAKAGISQVGNSQSFLQSASPCRLTFDEHCCVATWSGHHLSSRILTPNEVDHPTSREDKGIPCTMS